VNYPTKADFMRVRKIKKIDVEETGSRMFFEDWCPKEIKKWGLYDVWVRIKGCPDQLCRDYLALFVVGSLIGKTEEIDMKYTRENGVVRARVSCLNPAEIPQSVSHYYDGEGYNIHFVIESVDGVSIQEENQEDNERPRDQEKKGDDTHSNDESENNVQPKAAEDAAKKGNNSNSSNSAKGDSSAPSDQETVNVGSIAISYSLNSMASSCYEIERDCKSVPTKKRWADWVDEDAEDPSFSAPPKIGRMLKTEVHKSLKPTEADVSHS
jgi:hypothetical protein